MEKMKPRTLSGFMELLPEKQRQFELFLEHLRKTYALYGFTPLDTPVIEASEVLLAKAGGETEKQIYRFTKGDTDLSLRFDLTVPLAKYVALYYGSLSFPFRRYQIGKVFRGERAQRGRFREFYQADIDIIGDGQLDIVNEAELPGVIYRVFTGLGLDRFKIRLNNRKILNGFFEYLGLAEKSADVMRTVDKLDKIGPNKVLAELLSLGVPDSAAGEVLRLISGEKGSRAALEKLEALKGKNSLLDEGIRELSTVVGFMPAFSVPEDHFEIDLTIARGLDYYTGTVYETVLTDYPEIGSICSGGRYESLAEYYTDKPLPGVGLSIGLTRLFFVLGEQGLLSDEHSCAPADALIIPLTADLSPALRLATLLRENGIRTQLFSEDKKFKAKLNYADKLKIPYVLLLGEDEIAAGSVSLKDMTNGGQALLDEQAAAEKILAGLSARRGGFAIKEKTKNEQA